MSNDSPAGLIQYSKEILTLGQFFDERSVEYARVLDKNSPLADPTGSDTVASATDLSGKAFSHPTTGMKDLDNIIKATLRLVGALHHMVADAMYNHGSKLVAAYNNMQAADVRSRDAILGSVGSQHIVAQDPSGIDPARPSPYKDTQEPLTRPSSFGTGDPKSVPIDGYPAAIGLKAPSIGRLASLPSTTKNLIKVNHSGLQTLAGDLYGIVSKVYPRMTVPLRDAVERVVSDDTDAGGTHTASDGTKWLGQAAQLFKNMFRLDIGTMNGLNCVICAIAQIIDNLASNLAAVEQVLELNLDNYLTPLIGSSAYSYLETECDSEDDPSKGLHFDYGELALGLSGSSSSLPSPTDLIKAVTEIETNKDSLNVMLNAAVEQANDIRRRAAVEMAGVNDLLAQSFDRYAAHSPKGGSGTADPETALTAEQAQSLGDLINGQRNSLKSSYKSLHAGSGSKSALTELKELGGDAATLSGALADVGDLTGSTSVKGGSSALKLIGDVLPIIAAIGLDLL